MDTLLDDGGVPDPAKIRTAVDAARTHFGITNKPRPGVGLPGAMAPQPPRDQWRDAFTPRTRRDDQ